MFLLIFVMVVEDVVEPDPSIMSMIGVYLDACSLVSDSPTEARNILIAQVSWGRL